MATLKAGTTIGGLSIANSVFASGTRMMFVQETAPVGWVKETGIAYDDATLRVVGTGSFGTGGTINFSSAFVSRNVEGALTKSSSVTGAYYDSTTVYDQRYNINFSSTGLDMSVKYVDIIIATKS